MQVTTSADYVSYGIGIYEIGFPFGHSVFYFFFSVDFHSGTAIACHFDLDHVTENYSVQRRISTPSYYRSLLRMDKIVGVFTIKEIEKHRLCEFGKYGKAIMKIQGCKF